MTIDTRPPTRIGVAIVEHRGRYLVGVRQPTQTLAGKAEFPGGKCLPEEFPADCAVRECREETSLEVIAREMIYAIEHQYSHDVVAIEFWLCELSAESSSEPLSPFAWKSRELLSTLDFPAANDPVIALLLKMESA